MGQSAAGKSELDLAEFTDALDAGIQGVIRRGKAEPGDKTMVDALGPALEALRGAGDDDVAGALSRAAEAAREGMEATVPMVARKGRASYLGERSAGHQDPGATSSHLLLKTVAEAVGSGGAAG
jgi:dihydroxyacetone kinase-like protein